MRGKCVFGDESIDFLGRNISANSLEPQRGKLAALRYLSSPIYLSGMGAALGLFSYYTKFDKHSIAFPLNGPL